ncbi:hypothetical protein PFUGPA_05485 [Plasmodium falciparum Palo Alto/Uganda]|uniref:Uncharacterized protein n=1 Tax=Plasmodium falciparum (isolate Palo Alto / Uganda) TaxID=57270 RepID=W4IR93_PLAFP|nr:hypothetical protein PFUGPA_05485 [Plasmodium falciparum Palo Alto/Uganda]
MHIGFGTNYILYIYIFFFFIVRCL